MSYILDALKKAERERDIKQVPTLMAAHLPGIKHSKRPWVILGALAICAGVAIWTPAAFAENDECAGALSHGRRIQPAPEGT